VSASVFSGSFVGNGSALTGVSAEWDGTRNGNAEITGSLIVSGAAGTKVDFTKVAAISGSVFSGSFVGDGSGLTGIISNSEWDGTRNGNAEITGSFIVSGSSPTINLKGVTTIDRDIRIHNPSSTSLGIGAGALNTDQTDYSIAIGRSAAANAMGDGIIVIGYKTGQEARSNSIYIGFDACTRNKGTETVAIGRNVLQASVEAYEAVVIGDQAMRAYETGKGNVSIGAGTLPNLRNGNQNTVVGHQAGSPKLGEGSGNVYIGANSGDYVSEEYNQLYIDNSTKPDALIRGDFGKRTLTLNALQVIVPNLPKFETPEYDALPAYGLYRDGNGVFIKLP
jgi:hypothetical protein